MTYGVIIDGVNTKTAYDLILCADLSIEEPKVRTAMVEIPGKSGSYDFSEALANEPVFGDRNISFSLFKRVKDCELMALRNVLAEQWNGKVVKLILPTDPMHYYEGRMTVGQIGNHASGRIYFSMVAGPYMGVVDAF